MELTSAQQDILDQVRARRQKESEYADVAGNPWFRTFAQGATLGWSDEIEAAVRSVLPESLGGGEYQQIRDELRAKLAAYKQANPKTAITTEIAGALVPTIASMFLTGGASAATVPATMTRIAGTGALQGAIQGGGTSEAKDIGGMARDVGVGTATGAVLSPVVSVAARPIASGAGRFVDWARTKLGDKASNAVQAELKRFIDLTGKSEDEIIMDLYNGNLISDNKTLMAALKDYVVRGGQAGKSVLEGTTARAKETQREAMSGLRDVLAKDIEPNVVRGFKQSSEQLQKAESEAFNQIFKNTPNTVIGADAAQDMLMAAQTVPGVMDSVNSAYGMRNIVPLFVKRENGAIEMVRQPTLQDAEMMRRALQSRTNQLYSGSQTDLAPIVKEMEQSLRSKIDTASVELASTRKNWSNIKGASEQFDNGRKALTMNVDELEMLVDKVKKDPTMFNAFKAGVMDSIRNKVRRSKTTLANLADEDKQFGAALRTVLNPTEISRIESSLKRAGDVTEISQKLPITAGSITNPLMRAQRDSGSGFAVTDAYRAVTGDPMAIISGLGKMLRGAAPDLSDAERMQVVQLLYTRNPDFVMKALNDDTALKQFVDMARSVISAGGQTARTGIQQQTIGGETGLLNRITERK